ncbi:MAG: cyanophycinase [Limisphaerales bacterium]|jgi:cyanophycinase
MVRDGQVVGAQLVLGDGDSIHFVGSYGVRNIESEAPVDENTQFCIGSCSKMFAGAVIMTLVADGTLELDVPIDRWLPKFANLETETESAKRAPTLRELLCHEGGIYSQRKRLTDRQARWIRDYRLSLEESVAGIAREKLLGQPGAQHMYSGAGYCVLGRVAEIATGKAFNELLLERIARPLDLTATTFFPRSDQVNISVGHVSVGAGFVVNTNTPHLLGPEYRLALVGGNIYSTGLELARFAQMLINNGTHKGKTIVPMPQFQEMTKPQSRRDGGGYGFGVGVQVDAVSDRTVRLSHGGSLAGSYSFMLMNVETRRFGLVTYTGQRSKSQMGRMLAQWVDASTDSSAIHGPGKGTLVIVGGNEAGNDYVCFREFVRLAGGKNARIVLVPTAVSSSADYDYQNHRMLETARKLMGLTAISVLHTHDRAIADSAEFVKPLCEADAVWFSGGRQWRLVDAYSGTATEKEFGKVLERGGVIGGSSAGASIQGSFLMRGDTKGSHILIGDHQHGFGFLKDSAIDQHLIPRNRQLDLIKVLTDSEGRLDPSFDRLSLLGIGLDEAAGIVVRRDEFEVIGKPDRVVLVYDSEKWTDDLSDGDRYQALWHGARFDLAKREVLHRGTPPIPKSEHRAEGFYKDIFMDGGVNLSSRKQLPAAESLGLSYELYAGKDADKQRALISGSAWDENGVLLYPDGQPRFRLIYVNGGGATAHGKSIEKSGRNVFRKFFANGGSYSGSCAGSFLSGRNTDKKTPPRLGYLHIFPYNTLNTGMKKARVGHVIPHGSPLLDYHDFGGDYYVSNIYHNNGNWLALKDVEEMKDVEVLATYDIPDQRPHEGAAIWAYKKRETEGRVLNIGSHPEGITSGERLDLTEACFNYALEGVGTPQSKGRLKNGVVRKMNQQTSDNDPAHTRIGDLQYHHFDFQIENEATDIELELQGQRGFEFAIYLNEGEPAFRSNADHANVAAGNSKRLQAQVTPGHWFVSVECTTRIEAELDVTRGFFNYLGNTAVLNGASYEIKLTH